MSNPMAPAQHIPGAPIAATDVTAYMQQQFAGGGPPAAGGNELAQYDLSNLTNKNYELLPNGTVVEVAIRAAKMDSKSDGKRQLVLETEVVWPAEYAGVTINDYIYFTPESIWKFGSLAKATDLEVNGRFIGGGPEAFIGRVVRCTTSQNHYIPENPRTIIKGGFNHPKNVGVPTAAPAQAAPVQGQVPGAPVYVPTAAPQAPAYAPAPPPVVHQVVPNPNMPYAAPQVPQPIGFDPQTGAPIYAQQVVQTVPQAVPAAAAAAPDWSTPSQ